VPVLCVTVNDGSVSIFELDTSSSLVKAKAVLKSVLFLPSQRLSLTVCSFLPCGDLVTAKGSDVIRWNQPSFTSAGDPRTDAARIAHPITAMYGGYCGHSDGSVWDMEKNMWERMNVPVSYIAASSLILCIAWGDVLGCIELTRNVRRRIDLQHCSLITAICIFGPTFCVVTSNANVTMWQLNQEMPKRFKAGPEQENQIQQGLTYRLHDAVVLPCLGASISPGGALLAVCTSGDAVLVQQYFRQRHLGACVEVWVAKNPMLDTIQDSVRRYFSKGYRPLSLAEFIYVDDEFVENTEFMESLSIEERNALYLEAKKEISPTKHDDGRKWSCFCSAETTISSDLLRFKCTAEHEMPACIDTLKPIEPFAETYTLCDFCSRASTISKIACSYCLHKTSLLQLKN